MKDVVDDTTMDYVNKGTFGIVVMYVDIATDSTFPNSLQDQIYFSVHFGCYGLCVRVCST